MIARPSCLGTEFQSSVLPIRNIWGEGMVPTCVHDVLVNCLPCSGVSYAILIQAESGEEAEKDKENAKNEKKDEEREKSDCRSGRRFGCRDQEGKGRSN